MDERLASNYLVCEATQAWWVAMLCLACNLHPICCDPTVPTNWHQHSPAFSTN